MSETMCMIDPSRYDERCPSVLMLRAISVRAAAIRLRHARHLLGQRPSVASISLGELPVFPRKLLHFRCKIVHLIQIVGCAADGCPSLREGTTTACWRLLPRNV